jgi:hypothetical protein
VAGVHLEAPFGRYEVLAQVLADAGVRGPEQVDAP